MKFPKPKKREKRRKRINPVSEKRRGENVVYKELRKEFMASNPVCERCGSSPSVDVHHSAGRDGFRFLAVHTWFALCRACHDFVEGNPEWALRVGWRVHPDRVKEEE